MKYYIVFKEPIAAEIETDIFRKPEYSHYSLPNEKAATDVMSSEGFSEYIRKHGYHFNDELACVASDMMINSNGSKHKWTPQLIRTQLRLMGITDYGKCTIGDITYLANMAYADLYPDVLRDDVSCIKYAIKSAKDPDGYDGLVMSRWVSDLIGKKLNHINWSLYI